MQKIDQRWKAVGKLSVLTNPKSDLLYAEGLKAAPGSYLKEDTVKALPRRALIGRCRICGKTSQLTREHIPPKGSGNKHNTVDYSLGDWLKKQDITDMGKGRTLQGGIWAYTLCRSCNSLTGRKYGNEYQKWAYGGYKALSEIPLQELNDKPGPFGQKIQFGVKDHPVRPGALARQVLSLMCSLSGTWDLSETFPEIRDIVLNETAAKLPESLDLGMTLYSGPRARLAGPQLRVNIEENSWEWLMEMAFPPLAFILVLASSKPHPLHGLVMNEWTLRNPQDELIFRGEVEIGFGWSPYPGDYRTLAKIQAEANQD